METMNKPLNPLVMIGVGLLALVLLGLYGWHALQPAPYLPTPGVAGRPKHDPPYMRPGAPKPDVRNPSR